MYRIKEDAGTSTFDISIEGPAPSCVSSISFDLNITHSGTATLDHDYVMSLLTQTVTVSPCQSSLGFTFLPVDDNTFERTQSVTLRIEPGTHYQVGSVDEFEITIEDDDTPPVLKVTAFPGMEGENNMGFNLKLVGPGSEPDLSVGMEYIDGTAIEDEDYIAGPSEVTFRGDRSATGRLTCPSK